MPLDINSLDNSIARLDEGLARYRRDVSDIQIRDGLIQRFEFTYELSHKLLRRYLESVSANPAELDMASFQEIVRMGNEQGLLSGDWQKWRSYREMRSKTSHTYNEQMALDVVEAIPGFLSEAMFLRDQLKGRPV